MKKTRLVITFAQHLRLKKIVSKPLTDAQVDEITSIVIENDSKAFAVDTEGNITVLITPFVRNNARIEFAVTEEPEPEQSADE